MLGVALTLIFALWRYGKEEQWTAEESDNVALSRTTLLRDNQLILHPDLGGSTITPISGLGIFFDKSGNSATTPAIFLHSIQKFGAAPEVSLFFHLRPLSVPTVAPSERYAVVRCHSYGNGPGKQPIPNCFRLIVRHGYTDEVITPDRGILAVIFLVFL